MARARRKCLRYPSNRNNSTWQKREKFPVGATFRPSTQLAQRWGHDLAPPTVDNSRAIDIWKKLAKLLSGHSPPSIEMPISLICYFCRAEEELSKSPLIFV
eukprot:scaffold22078_cov84-Skeletonema_dohrnii-CCMP3373.AAC.3